MIARLLDLPPMEPPRFRLFLKVAASLSAIFGFVIVAYLAGTTVFLSQCDPRHLPVAFMVGYLLTMVLSWVVNRFRTTPPDRVLRLFFSIYVVAFVVIARVLTEPTPWRSAVTLAFCLPLPTLSWMIYWNVVQKYVDIGEMKTWTPTLNSLGLLVQVAFSFTLGFLTRHLGVGNVFLVSGLLLILAWSIVERIDEETVEPPKSAGVDTEAPPECPGSATLVHHLAWISVLFAIGKFGTEFQLNCAARARFSDPARLAGFLGHIESLSKLLLVFCQAFLMKRLLSRYSPATVHAVLPATLLVVSTITLMTGLDGSIVAFVVFTALGKGSFPTFINVSLAALPADRAREARLRLDGIWYAAGAVSVSLLCWAIPSLLTPERCALMIGTVSAVHLLACLGVDPAYVAVLGTGVTRGRPGDVEMPGAHPSPALSAEPIVLTLREIGDRETARAPLVELARLMDSPDPEERLRACRIVRELGHRAFLDDLLLLLADPHPAVRSEVLLHLEGVWQPTVLSRVEALASADPEPAVRAHAERIAERIRQQEMSRGVLPDLLAALEGRDVPRFVASLLARPPAPAILAIVSFLWALVPAEEARRIVKQVLEDHLACMGSGEGTLPRVARVLGCLARNPAVERGLLTVRGNPSRQHVSLVQELLQMTFPDPSVRRPALEILRREETLGLEALREKAQASPAR